MSKDLMYQCEVRKPHVVFDENHKATDKRTMKWVEIEASEAPLTAELRCVHCHGAVRLHKQKKPKGPADHVQHRDREDSEGCRGGAYFNGLQHQMSLNPVL